MNRGRGIRRMRDLGRPWMLSVDTLITHDLDLCGNPNPNYSNGANVPTHDEKTSKVLT